MQVKHQRHLQKRAVCYNISGRSRQKVHKKKRCRSESARGEYQRSTFRRRWRFGKLEIPEAYWNSICMYTGDTQECMLIQK